MGATLEALGILQMSREQRLALVGEIWDSLARETNSSLLSPAHRAELDRRADEADADPDGGKPWEEVKANILARIRHQ